jgi:hypothetical protein
VEALASAVDELDYRAPPPEVLDAATTRGHFRPDEESAVVGWFAGLLTIRNALWEVVAEASRPLEGEIDRVIDVDGWRCFVLGYTAACLIVRVDRMVLEDVASNGLVQRKLNEGSVAHRIPRKQYTAIFESFSDPKTALAMEQAMRFARSHRNHLADLERDSVVGELVVQLPNRERALIPGRRRYLSRLLGFLEHAVRRTGASARQQALFAALETGGRLASELHDRWTPDRVGKTIRRRIGELLQPGDILVTRHDTAVTNLFLPGYWPHAALFVGGEGDRRRLAIELDSDRRDRWGGDRMVLEALKDGVLFRRLDETLAVDAVAVIRPQIDQTLVAQAIARAARHEGKGYDFDFDFFRSDMLVCTEVIYRAYDGVGPLRLTLTERSGRPTLSAEDLLDLALEGSGFAPVAVFGAPTCPAELVVGEEAHEAIRGSYR